jgi:hypothetical protein
MSSTKHETRHKKGIARKKEEENYMTINPFMIP